MLGARTQTSSHMEYIQPLPTPPNYDAKKSPLALLAQTCSSIGKDDPPAMTLREAKPAPILAGDYSSKAASPEKAATTASSVAVDTKKLITFTPYKQTEKHEESKSNNSSSGGNASESGKRSPAAHGDHRKSPDKSKTSDASASTARHHHHTSDRTSQSSPLSAPATIELPSSILSVSEDKSATSAASPPVPLVPLSAATGGPSIYHGYAALGHSVPLIADPSAVSPSLRAQIEAAAHHQASLAAKQLAAVSSPYTPYSVSAPRIKSSSAIDACADPYCKNCQIQAAQLAAAAAAAAAATVPCPNGCVQCKHEGAAAAANYHHPGLSMLPLTATVPTSAAYPSLSPSFLLATAGLGLPPPPPHHHQHKEHICNWVSGTTSCGKRFASGEELLQHLRSHTVASSEASATAQALAGLTSFQNMYYTAASNLAAVRPPGIPSVSPLASSLRYHPYMKPTSSPMSSVAYYSPYPYMDLKQRLAAAVPQ